MTNDPLSDQADRAGLLALLERARDRGEYERADALRRRLAALGVTVRLTVARPRRRSNSGGEA